MTRYQRTMLEANATYIAECGALVALSDARIAIQEEIGELGTSPALRLYERKIRRSQAKLSRLFTTLGDARDVEGFGILEAVAETHSALIAIGLIRQRLPIGTVTGMGKRGERRPC